MDLDLDLDPDLILLCLILNLEYFHLKGSYMQDCMCVPVAMQLIIIILLYCVWAIATKLYPYMHGFS